MDGGQILKKLDLENLDVEYKAHLNRDDVLSWAKTIVGFANGKTSTELMKLCGLSSKPYFLSSVLYPLMERGLLERVGAARSPKARYRTK